MQKTLQLTFLFQVISIVLFGQIHLGQPISISVDKAFGTHAPRIAAFADGTPVIFWNKSGSSPSMYLSVRRDTGFSYPITVPTGNITPSIFGGTLGPEIATFDNTLFITFESYGVGIYCIRSEDRGATFSDPVLVTNLSVGRIATLPDIGIDDVGNPMISFVSTNRQEEEALYEIAFSKDGGQSFEPSIIANESAAGEEVCECCPASVLAAKDSIILLAFRNNDSNIRDIWVTKSTDYGATFTEAIDVDDTDWEIFGCPSKGPSSTVIGDTLFNAFFSLGEGRARAYLSTMHVADNAVADQIKLPSFFGNDAGQNAPRLAGKNDTLAIVWQERQGFGDDIILGYSTTGTGGLEYTQISDGQLSEINPDVVIAGGNFHITYADQREGLVFYRAAGFSPFSKTADISKVQQITASPNPASDATLIDLSGFNSTETLRGSLFTYEGKLVRKMAISDTYFLLKKEDLTAGIYFLKIESSRENGLVKVIFEE